MVEHVRSASRLVAWLQDVTQPLWTRVTGGCRPNRRTEDAVAAAGFAVEPASYAAEGNMRRLEARPAGRPRE